jgi:transcriptional regulator NrdR family protein
MVMRTELRNTDVILRRRRRCLTCQFRFSTVELEADKFDAMQPEAIRKQIEAEIRAHLADKLLKGKI